MVRQLSSMLMRFPCGHNQYRSEARNLGLEELTVESPVWQQTATLEPQDCWIGTPTVIGC
jgi:hypothetical protein